MCGSFALSFALLASSSSRHHRETTKNGNDALYAAANPSCAYPARNDPSTENAECIYKMRVTERRRKSESERGEQNREAADEESGLRAAALTTTKPEHETFCPAHDDDDHQHQPASYPA